MEFLGWFTRCLFRSTAADDDDDDDNDDDYIILLFYLQDTWYCNIPTINYIPSQIRIWITVQKDPRIPDTDNI